MSKPSVLLIGAGFVGGTILTRLLEDGYPLSVLFRREEQEKALKDLGVKPIKASLDDSEAVADIVSQHDVIINTASSDHPGSVEATIKGIQRRVDERKKTIYIHTSGTGVLTDEAGGKFKSDKIYNDEDPDVMEPVDDGAPHRAIDKNLASKGAEWRSTGLVEVRIVVPPLIWGVGTGPFKKHSIQIPSLIDASLKAGQAVVHGPGLAVWNQVHVRDLADGYMKIFEALLKGELKLRSDTDAYIFAAGDEFAWVEISQRISEELQKKGLCKKEGLKELTNQEAKDAGLAVPKEAWGLAWDYQQVGSNSRSRAWKLRQLGWQPTRSTKDQLLDSIGNDVDVVAGGATLSTPGVEK